MIHTRQKLVCVNTCVFALVSVINLIFRTSKQGRICFSQSSAHMPDCASLHVSCLCVSMDLATPVTCSIHIWICSIHGSRICQYLCQYQYVCSRVSLWVRPSQFKCGLICQPVLAYKRRYRSWRVRITDHSKHSLSFLRAKCNHINIYQPIKFSISSLNLIESLRDAKGWQRFSFTEAFPEAGSKVRSVSSPSLERWSNFPTKTMIDIGTYWGLQCAERGPKGRDGSILCFFVRRGMGTLMGFGWVQHERVCKTNRSSIVLSMAHQV